MRSLLQVAAISGTLATGILPTTLANASNDVDKILKIESTLPDGETPRIDLGIYSDVLPGESNCLDLYGKARGDHPGHRRKTLTAELPGDITLEADKSPQSKYIEIEISVGSERPGRLGIYNGGGIKRALGFMTLDEVREKYGITLDEIENIFRERCSTAKDDLEERGPTLSDRVDAIGSQNDSDTINDHDRTRDIKITQDVLERLYGICTNLSLRPTINRTGGKLNYFKDLDDIKISLYGVEFDINDIQCEGFQRLTISYANNDLEDVVYELRKRDKDGQWYVKKSIDHRVKSSDNVALEFIEVANLLDEYLIVQGLYQIAYDPQESPKEEQIPFLAFDKVSEKITGYTSCLKEKGFFSNYSLFKDQRMIRINENSFQIAYDPKTQVTKIAFFYEGSIEIYDISTPEEIEAFHTAISNSGDNKLKKTVNEGMLALDDKCSSLPIRPIRLNDLLKDNLNEEGKKNIAELSRSDVNELHAMLRMNYGRGKIQMGYRKVDPNEITFGFMIDNISIEVTTIPVVEGEETGEEVTKLRIIFDDDFNTRNRIKLESNDEDVFTVNSVYDVRGIVETIENFSEK